MKEDRDYSYRVIGAAIRVQKQHGIGLLESAYQVLLEEELEEMGLAFESQKEICITSKRGKKVRAYYADLIVEGKLIVELKSMSAVRSAHKAQLRTYMKLGGYENGLLINFGAIRIKEDMVKIELT